MRNTLAILWLLTAGLQAQDDPLSARLEAEQALVAELSSQQVNVDLSDAALADGAAWIEALAGIAVEIPAQHADESIQLVLRQVSLWNVLRLLASQTGLHIVVDPDDRRVLLTTAEEAGLQRVEAVFSARELERLLARPDRLPRPPQEIAETEPGSYRLRLGGSDVAFSGVDGAVAIVDGGLALLLDDSWSAPPDEQDSQLLEILQTRVSLDFMPELSFEDRIDFIRQISRLPLVVSRDALGAAEDIEAPALKLTDTELGVALKLLLAQYPARLRFKIDAGVVLVGTAAELKERKLAVRCFDDDDGSELWTAPILLEGGGTILGLRLTRTAVLVYTRSERGDEAWIFVRRTGVPFARIPLR